MRALPLCVLTACFNPSPQTGLRCSPTGWCPWPQRCEPITQICEGSAPGVDAAIDANYVFLTSTQVPFTLTTPATADLECAAAAARGGLRGAYVAWISTQTMDAKNRIPPTARGWVRPDGLPFGDTLQEILNGEIYYPPILDEHGQPHVNVNVGTGTKLDGTHSTETCDASPNITFGVSDGASPHWTDAQSLTLLPCSNSLHLYCFGTDRNAEIPPPAAAGRLAFLTDTTYPAELGVNSLDAACADEARAQGLPGEYVAMVATTEQAAKDRSQLSTAVSPWVRRDGVVVTTDLVTFMAPLTLTSARNYRWELVMVGAPSLDVKAQLGETCGNWMQSASTLSAGISSRSAIGDAFSGYRTALCDQRLYCFQR